MPDAPVAFRLPDLGEGMAEAEIVRWEVAVGDHIARDQVVVIVQTDKAEVELPAPDAGTVTALGGEPGDVLEVGAVLMEISPDGTPTPQLASKERALRVPATQVRSEQKAAGARAAPPVRKLAKDLGVDLDGVTGSGPDGRVTADDVRAAASVGTPVAAAAAGERREPLRGIPRAMARNMAEAWRTVPHISLFDEIDARPLLDALRTTRAQVGDDSLTLTAFFVRAAVLALAEYPVLNASLDETGDEIVYHDAVHVGIAVNSDAGLVVPVVHDAQARSLVDLGAEIVRLTDAARAGGLAPELLRGATFSVTNFGTEGGRFATPIVRPPQVAILGTGAIRTRPIVEDDRVVAAPALPLSLSADHRVVDGHHATVFLDDIATRLGRPLALATH